jgi:RNA polymerase sigma factor (sigma-70 family)
MKRDRHKSTDQERLETLFRSHRTSVRRRLLCALRGDLCRVDDLTTETFLRVLKVYGSSLDHKTEQELRALLIRTAENCVIDAWRKDSKLIFRDTYLDSDVPLDRSRGADDDQFEQVLDRDLVQRFIEVAAKRLTDGEFRVAFLGWLMDESDEAIAKALGTTIKTVRAHRYSARKKIKTFANRDGQEITFTDTDVVEEKKSTPGVGEVTV